MRGRVIFLMACLCSCAMGEQVFVRQVFHARAGGSSGLWTDTNSYAIVIDEGTNATGNALDNSGNGFAVVHIPTPATGPLYLNLGTNTTRNLAEHGWSFDGSDDSQTITNGAAMTNSESFSVGGWLWKGVNNLSSVHLAITKRPSGAANPDWQFAWVDATASRFIIYDTGQVAYVYSDIVLPTGKWVFVECVYDSSIGHDTNAIIIYTNGLLAAQARTESGAFVSRYRGTGTVYVARNVSATLQWDGYMDFMHFSGYAMSSNAAYTLWLNTGGTSGPVGNIRARLPAGAY